jgi:Fe-S-cluster-containing dehydrogenase component
MKPACVRTCTTGALEYGPIGEISEKMRKRASIRMSKGLARLSETVD